MGQGIGAMSGDWARTKAQKSDIYMPDVKRIIGAALLPLIICDGTVHEDRHENTDLRLLQIKPFVMAVRVRDIKFADQYPFDVTIRSPKTT